MDEPSIDPRKPGRPAPPRAPRTQETNGRASHAEDQQIDVPLSSSASGKMRTSRRGCEGCEMPGFLRRLPGPLGRERRASARSGCIYLPGGEGGQRFPPLSPPPSRSNGSHPTGVPIGSKPRDGKGNGNGSFLSEGGTKRGTIRGEEGERDASGTRPIVSHPRFSLGGPFLREDRIEALLVPETWTSSDPPGRSTRRRGAGGWEMRRSSRKEGRIVRRSTRCWRPFVR